MRRAGAATVSELLASSAGFVSASDTVCRDCIASPSFADLGVIGSESTELGDDGKKGGSVGSVIEPIGERPGVGVRRNAGEVGVFRRT